jgi:hypothetical protein
MVDEVSKETVASDGGGRFPVDFDGAAEGVDAVGWRETAGGRRGFTLWVKRRNGFDRAYADQDQSDRQQNARRELFNCRS